MFPVRTGRATGRGVCSPLTLLMVLLALPLTLRTEMGSDTSDSFLVLAPPGGGPEGIKRPAPGGGHWLKKTGSYSRRHFYYRRRQTFAGASTTQPPDPPGRSPKRLQAPRGGGPPFQPAPLRCFRTWLHIARNV